MKDSEKSSRVLRASAGKILKDEKLKPLKVVDKSKSLSNAVCSKNCLAWYVALNSKPPKDMRSCVPLVKWKCPPKVNLNPCWHVAAGEGSQEREAQMLRETMVREVYPHSSAIPSSVSSPPNLQGEYCDDSQIPIVPIIPIEETAGGGEMPAETPPPVSTINSQPLASPKCPPVFGNLPLSQFDTIGPQRQPANHISHPDKLLGLGGSDLDLVVAAAATVAAIMESKEQIDTNLLVKFLANPEMVKKLIEESKLTSKPEHGAPAPLEPASVGRLANECKEQIDTDLLMKFLANPEMVKKQIEESKLSFKPEQGAPAPPEPASVGRLVNECNEQLRQLIPSNIRPLALNQSLSLPCAKMEMTDNLASKPGGTYAVNAPIRTLWPDRSHIHQTAGVKQVRPLMSSSSRSDEETMTRRSISQYGIPDVIGYVKQQEPLNPSTSKPSMEEIKKLINRYGAADARGIKSLASPLATPPGTADMEGMRKPLFEVGVPDYHQCGLNPSFHPATLLRTAMVMPHTENLAELPKNALASRYVSPGKSHLAPFSPMTISGPQTALNYNKSPHRPKHETPEHKFLKLGPGLEQVHKTKSAEMNSKYQKPCLYYNTTEGCRNGSKCPYQHGVLKQWRLN